jgi:hypothetical protein
LRNMNSMPATRERLEWRAACDSEGGLSLAELKVLRNVGVAPRSLRYDSDCFIKSAKGDLG